MLRGLHVEKDIGGIVQSLIGNMYYGTTKQNFKKFIINEDRGLRGPQKQRLGSSAIA